MFKWQYTANKTFTAKWTQCAAGTYENNGTCISCAAGTFSVAGATVCTPCPSGQTTETTGQSSCVTCSNNAYVDSWNNSGSWNIDTNATVTTCSIKTCKNGYQNQSNACSVITYNIKYYDGSTELTSLIPTTYNVTTDTITLPTPSKTGYTFGGWATSSGGTQEHDANATITLDGTRQFFFFVPNRALELLNIVICITTSGNCELYQLPSDIIPINMFINRDFIYATQILVNNISIAILYNRKQFIGIRQTLNSLRS